MVSLTWLGHSSFILAGDAAVVAIDPWPQDDAAGALLRDAGLTLIALTHGHFDHVGNAVELSVELGVPIVAMPELAAWCRNGGATAELVNYGGTYPVDGAALKCVPAWHSSSVGPDRVYAGSPCGYVVELGGLTIYYAGDTCLFGDMALIAAAKPIDVAILPIGGRTTMDPQDALRAVDLVKPRLVIPMHYDTWEFIAQDAGAFCRDVESQTSAQGLVLEAGAATPVPL